MLKENGGHLHCQLYVMQYKFFLIIEYLRWRKLEHTHAFFICTITKSNPQNSSIYTYLILMENIILLQFYFWQKQNDIFKQNKQAYNCISYAHKITRSLRTTKTDLVFREHKPTESR